MEVIGYTADGTIASVLDGERMIVPDAPANSHRQMIAEWEAEGNTIPVYVPEPTAPPPLHRLTFWLAAAYVGVSKDGIKARIEQIEDPVEREKSLAFLEDATVYRRDDPLLNAMATAEGISQEQLDALWVWAAA